MIKELVTYSSGESEISMKMVLGSIEYACGVAGSKAILVLGHTKCGAVTAACQGVELGNITALLSKVKPAIKEVQERINERLIK